MNKYLTLTFQTLRKEFLKGKKAQCKKIDVHLSCKIKE